jgi:hypothetical protein
VGWGWYQEGDAAAQAAFVAGSVVFAAAAAAALAPDAAFAASAASAASAAALGGAAALRHCVQEQEDLLGLKEEDWKVLHSGPALWWY